jgi:hypothetical protein
MTRQSARSVCYSSDAYFAGLTSGFSGLRAVPAQAGVWIEKMKGGEPPKPVLAGINLARRGEMKKPPEARRAPIWRSA